MTLPHESGPGRNYIMCAYGSLIHEVPGMLGLYVCTCTHTDKAAHGKSVSDKFLDRAIHSCPVRKAVCTIYWYHHTVNLQGQETLAIYTCRHNDFIETKILQITDLLPH